MNKPTIPLYIHYGDIPENGMSRVHLGDYVARTEGGLSVYEAIEANGRYYPLLQEDANEAGIADYFNFLLEYDGPVYLLTGSRIRLEGAGREPLLQSWQVLKEISFYYNKECREAYDKRRAEGKLKDVKAMRGDIYKMQDNVVTEVKNTAGEIVCLCGSMKFYDEILAEATKLTLQGNIVLTPFKDHRDKSDIPQEDIETYDRIHRARIDKCDRVVVVNPGKYIGSSVESEIKYAESVGKPVSYTEEIKKPYIVTLCGSRKFQYEFAYQFERLTKQGKIVMTPAIFEMSSPDSLDAVDHANLDAIHQQKMAMSDEVLIINKGGYIGEDTRKEIKWCLEHGIKINYLEMPTER